MTVTLPMPDLRPGRHRFGPESARRFARGAPFSWQCRPVGRAGEWGIRVRFWNVHGPEVDAADAEPWDGPLAGTMRPFRTRAFLRLAVASAALYLLGGLAVVIIALASPHATVHHTAWSLLGSFGVTTGLGLFVMLRMVTPHQLRRIAPTLGFVNIMLASTVISIAVLSAGPRLGVAASAYVEGPLFAFYMLRRRWAVVSVVSLLALFAVIVAAQRGWVSPGGQWLILLSTVVATAILMGVIAEHSDRLAVSEHEARTELAAVNQGLEHRVQEQVSEIEGLNGLRRFLSPQVADAVVSGHLEALTRPHRSRIAVFFCDLRGFTSFTNEAEPEEVVSVLDEYYDAVGPLLQRFDATVGGYAGDGIMAYFGDPVACAEPALVAVQMADELRRCMNGVVGVWERRGYRLGYGAGVTFGYATLGVIGFDGRYDYTPLGAVVNLAARLCGRAPSGQVLLDQPTHTATKARLPSAHFADLDLKGYRAAVPAYALA